VVHHIPWSPLQRALVDRHQTLTTRIYSGDSHEVYHLPHGVAQGDSLGPMSFVLTYHDYIQHLERHRLQTGRVPPTGFLTLFGNTYTTPVHQALFIDDHAELWPATSIDYGLALVQELHDTQQGWGLHINPDKTQLMGGWYGKGTRRRKKRMQQRHYWQGRPLQTGTEATYLGSRLSATGTMAHEVTARINKAQGALSTVGRHIWKHPLSTALKVTLYCTMVRSVLVYGLETGHITKAQGERLEKLQTRALRWLSRTPAHITGEPSETLRARLKVPTIESYLRWRRLSWLQNALGHPETHVQVLASLFGRVSWDMQVPQWHDTEYLRMLHQDIATVLSVESSSLGTHPMDSTLLKVRDLSKADLRKVLTYHGTWERAQRVQYGPRNAPVHKCDLCSEAFDTLQRLALHRYSRHGIRNKWRHIATTQCPGCHMTFASLETARRHITRNVCTLAHAQPPPAPPAVGSARRTRTVHQPPPAIDIRVLLARPLDVGRRQ